MTSDVKRLELEYERMGLKLRSFQREAIKVALEFFHSRKPKPLLIQLPAGYGKTLIGESLLVYEVVTNDWSFARGLTYVLPTRAITHDVFKRLKERFNALNLKDIKELHGESDATDFYADVSVTTFDTFVYAFARRTHDYHLERPSGVIATSYVVFDETHMLQDEHLYSHSVMNKVLFSLYDAGVPVLVMTATMPDVLKEVIFKNRGRIECVPATPEEFKEPPQSYRGSLTRVDVKDTELFNYLKSYEFKMEIKQRRRVLIVVNTVERAVQAYDQLKQDNDLRKWKIILLHSRVRALERRLREECVRKLLKPEIKCELNQNHKGQLPFYLDENRVVCERCKSKNASEIEGVIFVATQVVEAGLDVSCELLVTECAPADAIVQRTGRCARYVNEKNGLCVIVKPPRYEPYPKALVENTLDFLKKCDDQRRVNCLTSFIDSYEFVNHVYRNFKAEEIPSNLHSTLNYLETIYPFTIDKTAIEKMKVRPNAPVFLFAPLKNEKIPILKGILEGEEWKKSYRIVESRHELTVYELAAEVEKLAERKRGEAFFIEPKFIRDRIFTIESVYLSAKGSPPGALLFDINYEKKIALMLTYTLISLKDEDEKQLLYKVHLIPSEKLGRGIEEGTYILNPKSYDMEKGLVKVE